MGWGGKSCDRSIDKADARKKVGRGGGRNGKKMGGRGDMDEFGEDNLYNLLVAMEDDDNGGNVRGGGADTRREREGRRA